MTQLSQFVRHDLNYDVTIPLRLRFLANVNVLRITLRLLNAMAIPSVVCLSVWRLLSVTLVHPTQAVELFGNFFTIR